jgi:hypothetical protein
MKYAQKPLINPIEELQKKMRSSETAIEKKYGDNYYKLNGAQQKVYEKKHFGFDRPGDKTEYEGTVDESRKNELKAAHALAFDHANYLKAKGHEDVKITRRYGKSITVPRSGVMVPFTYTVHHGSPPVGKK